MIRRSFSPVACFNERGLWNRSFSGVYLSKHPRFIHNIKAMGNTNNSKDRFNELLFENRNKNYGAYVLRRNYDRRLIVSMLCTLSFLVVAMFAPHFFNGPKLDLSPVNTKHDSLKIVDVHLPEKKKEIVEQKTSTEKPKGENKAAPHPIDTNKIVDVDTAKHDPLAGHGDPKGIDTTHKMIIAGNGTGPDTMKIRKKKEIQSYAEVNPEFPGGLKALYEFLKKNIKYPKVAIENEITGTVYLSFVVDEDGSITDIKNLNALAGGCDKEAIRVAGLMPKWKPGKMGNEAVPVRYSIPVKFALK